MLKIAVLDDDPLTLERYSINIPNWIDKHKLNGDLVLVTSSYFELMEEINNNKINVCVIDISLSDDVNGMHVAQKIRAGNYEIEIIFVTKCLDFIKQAFEVKAYQFIYKPGLEELETTLIKLAHEKEAQNQPYIKIKCNSDIYFIPIADINNIEREKSRTVVHSEKGDYVTWEGIEEIVNRINDARFKRCHRSIFVNSQKIYKIDLKHKNILLKNGTNCDIGPKYYADFYKEGQEII